MAKKSEEGSPNKTKSGNEYLEIPSKPKYKKELNLMKNPPRFEIDSSGSSTNTISPPKELKTFRMPPPPSDLMSRLQEFLPQMAKANQELESKMRESGKSTVDIENIENEEKPYIEMDLGLGVFDVKPKKKGSQGGDSGSSSNDDDDSLSDSSSELEELVVCKAQDSDLNTSRSPTRKPRIDLIKPNT